jgi:enediyne biosynthesis protein E4
MELLGIPCAQEAQLFLGAGRGKFRDASAQSGPYFGQLRIGRGLACSDFDNDGLPDLAFSHSAGTIALLHNRTETKNSWIRLELIGDGIKSNRNAIGARVEITSGDQRQVRFINGGGSYLSANDHRILAGLGTAQQAERVTVVWPSGRTQEFRDLRGRHSWRLVEGRDQAEEVIPHPAQQPRRPDGGSNVID